MDFDTYERGLWAGRAAAYERGFARLTAHTAGALLHAAGALLDAAGEAWWPGRRSRAGPG